MAQVKGLFIRSFEKSFRRAGRRFNRAGVFVPLSELSEQEIRTLKSDHNLVVDEREQDTAVGTLVGAVGADGRFVELKKMKADELKAIAADMGIDGAESMKKDDLVSAIAAKEVDLGSENEQE